MGRFWIRGQEMGFFSGLFRGGGGMPRRTGLRGVPTVSFWGTAPAGSG